MNHFNLKSTFLLLFIAFTFTSCRIDYVGKETVRGNKEVVTETRNIPSDFNQLKVAGMMDIVLLPGKQDGIVELKGESNILPYIETKIQGQSLVVKVNDSFNLRISKPLILTFKAGAVRNITKAGSGDIKTNGRLEGDVFGITSAGSGDMSLEFTAKTITISKAGSGDIRLMGDADNLELQKTGSGDISAFHLDVKNATINSAGSGDTEVRVSDELEIKSVGSGDVYYKGSPKTDINSVGSGKVKPS